MNSPFRPCRFMSAVCATLLLTMMATSANAGPITFTAKADPPGNVTEATVEAFLEVVGTNLQLTLSYKSATVSGDFDNGGVLTGFVFNIEGFAGSLGKASSAILADGAALGNASGGNTFDPLDPQPTGGNVGKGWASRNNIDTSKELSGQIGVGAAGAGVFGDDDTIIPLTKGKDGDPPLDGVDHGLIPFEKDNKYDYSFNNGLKDPVINGSVVFLFPFLSGDPSEFDPSKHIIDGYFLFSSNLIETKGDPNGDNPIQSVPAPPAFILMGIGGVSLLANRYRRRRKAAA